MMERSRPTFLDLRHKKLSIETRNQNTKIYDSYNTQVINMRIWDAKYHQRKDDIKETCKKTRRKDQKIFQ